MARSEFAPVTPEVLLWARETAGYELEAVAKRLQKTVAAVQQWETGEQEPTVVQLRALANLYQRPMAVFFFPAPPQLKGVREEFRTLPETVSLTPATLKEVRRMRAFQEGLYEVIGSSEPVLRFQPPQLRRAQVSAEAKAWRERLELEGRRWPNPEAAFKYCRDKVERQGVVVVKTAFKQDDISGFSLADSLYPLICINNKHQFTRQLFTLFHELGHLILDSSGVTTLDDLSENQSSEKNRNLEVLCNYFAAEVLVPSKQFSEQVKRCGTSSAAVGEMAEAFSVSREVILRRMLDKGLIGQAEYRARVEEVSRRQPARRTHTSQNGGGNYYNTQVAYWGENLLRRVFLRESVGLVSPAQIADCFNIKAQKLAKLEEYVSG